MHKINLVIISGSHRKTSESGKVATYIQHEIQKHDEFKNKFETDVINLAYEDTPFYEDRSTSSDARFATVWDPLAKRLDAANAFIVISPEWNGMVPAKLKNLFLLVNTELYHKPALIVTVSAGLGGHYPVAELRMSSYKNSRICYLPDHLIIRHVEDFNKNPNAEEFTEVRGRLENYLNTLWLYANALKDIRTQILNAPLTKKYPHGL